MIEPNYGWTLISIEDLGELDGICERKNCNTAIRYEHLAYHPQWGYKIVGSSCIQFLTDEYKLKSRDYSKIYKKIAKALNKFNWEENKTQKNRVFIFTEYKKSIIRIYEDDFSYQIIYHLGKKKFHWEKPYQAFNKTIQIELIKELVLIHLMGIIAKERDKEEELEILRDIFKNIKSSINI